MVIPYTKGRAESFENICGEYGIQAYFKGNTTIKQILMKPKDQDPKDKNSGVIYSYQCGDIACGEGYIGKTSRILGERYRKHLKQPSPIHAHIQQTGHTLSSAYIKVTFNKKLAITKENLHTKCFPLTIMINTLPIMKSLYEIATYNDFLDT